MYTHQIKSNRPAKELMSDNMIVKHYAGSISYGTNLPSSDIDFRGIFCADPINILTPFYRVEECEDQTEEDTKLFELSHFMKLCLDCNPNIIETLWVDEEDITFRTPAYDLLRENRHELLSSKIAFTTSGYALSQLKRIKGHHKWINQPQPKEGPAQIDFVTLVQNFTSEKLFKIDMRDYRDGYRLVPYGDNIFGVVKMKGYKTFSSDETLNITYVADENLGTTRMGKWGFSSLWGKSRKRPLFIIKFNKQEYNMAKDKHHQYWDWKKNRNVTRGKLEEDFGYDTKHAMHLVRLLRMGAEALRDGEIIVKRPDAQELLDIRAGAWTYDEIIKYAEDMDNEVRNVLYTDTVLPKKPNLKFAANLLMEVQESIWSSNER